MTQMKIDLCQVIDNITPRPIQPDTDHPERYGYVPLQAMVFIEILFQTIKYAEKLDVRSFYSFLDVGAGFGDKVEIANQHSRIDIAHGIEVQASDNFPRATCKHRVYYEVDAFKFDHYHVFDIIYLFNPMKKPEMMIELMKHIHARMSPNAIMVVKCLHWQYDAIRTSVFKDFLLNCSSNTVWITKEYKGE